MVMGIKSCSKMGIMDCCNSSNTHLDITLKKPLIIEGKKYYFHIIVWEDIVGDSTIASFDEFDKMKTATINSFAYIFKKDKKYLYTFASYSNDGYFWDRNIIPLGVVKKIAKI